MSPKAQTQLLLVFTVVCIATHPLALLFTTDGLPGIARYILLAGGVIGTIKLAYTQAIQSLSTVAGDVRPPPPTPPTSGSADATQKTNPPAASRLAFGRFVLVALVLLIAVLSLGSNCNSTQALNDFTPAGQCFFSAALSGKIDFANPATAALQLLALCAGTTTSDVINWIAQMTGTDAGIGTDPKAPTAAQLQAVLAAVKALPPTFTTGDAIRMLGSSKVAP